MRYVLLGAVESSRRALEVLLATRQDVAGILALPPERAARHSDYVSLRGLAHDHNIEIHEVVQAESEGGLETLRRWRPDVVFVIGWSEILSPRFLGVPQHGCVGFHPSALPAMRGRAVIPWTILAGAGESGSTLMWLSPGLDSGDIVAQRRFPLSSRVDARGLYDQHLSALADMLTEVLDRFDREGPFPGTPQDPSLATYCAQRVATDGLVNWEAGNSVVDRLVRASTRPYPGAYSYLRDRNTSVRIWEAEPVALPLLGVPGQVVDSLEGCPVVQCGDGQLVIRRFESEMPQLRRQHRFLSYAEARVTELNRSS